MNIFDPGFLVAGSSLPDPQSCPSFDDVIEFTERRLKLTGLLTVRALRSIVALSCHFSVLSLKLGFSSHQAGQRQPTKVSPHQSSFFITSRLTAHDSIPQFLRCALSEQSLTHRWTCYILSANNLRFPRLVVVTRVAIRPFNCTISSFGCSA